MFPKKCFTLKKYFYTSFREVLSLIVMLNPQRVMPKVMLNLFQHLIFRHLIFFFGAGLFQHLLFQHPVFSQELSEPLQSFSILSGASVTADSATNVKGSVGAVGTVDTTIRTTDTTLQGAVCVTQRALDSLTAARSKLAAAQPAQSYNITLLSDTTLASGTRNFSSSLTLSDTITLTGDSSSVFIFNINGSLTFDASMQLVLVGGVKAENVFFNVSSDVLVGDSAAICGNILADGTITCSRDISSLEGVRLMSADSVKLTSTRDTLGITPEKQLVLFGSTCGCAVDLGQGDTCVNNITMTDSVLWFRFVADSQRVIIMAANSTGNINSITVYSGTCGSLIAFDSIQGNSNTIFFEKTNFTIGQSYYVKLTSSQNPNLSVCVANDPVPNADCSCYNLSSATTEEVSSLSNPITPLTTLSPCTEYLFKYEIWASCTATNNPSITDTITINLPNGILMSSSTFTSNNSSVMLLSLVPTASPVFSVSSWFLFYSLNIKITAETPPCDSIPAPNSVTTISGIRACNSQVSVSNILTIAPANLSVLNKTTTGTLLLNTGDVTELVFKIKNVSNNNSNINSVQLTYTPDPTTVLKGYYLTTAIPPNPIPVDNHYTYNSSQLNTNNFPCSTFPCTLTIGQPEFLTLFNSNVFQDGDTFYLHIAIEIPWNVSNTAPCNSSTQTPGHYDFTWNCGQTVCDAVPQTTSINVLTDLPNLQATALTDSSSPPLLTYTNGTFCPGGNNSANIGFQYINNVAPNPNKPPGRAKATDLILYLYSDTTFGTLDSNSFAINNTSIPQSIIIHLAPQGNNDIYEIDFSQLQVSGNIWQPFGSNTLADLDGDSLADDLKEGESFTVTATFNYNPSRPANFGTCSSGSYVVAVNSRYNDQCFSILTSIPPCYNADCRQCLPFDVASACGPNAYYFYSASGPPGLMKAIPDPPYDILEGPFTLQICPGLYNESWGPIGFDFDCPNGYHQLSVTLPPGYHLQPGVIQLSQDTVSPPSACTGSPIMITPSIKEICRDTANNQPGYVLVNFGRLPLGNCVTASASYRLPCINLPLVLDCPDTSGICPPNPADPGGDSADVFSASLQYICDTAPSCSTCVSGITCANQTFYHHCLGACASYFSTDQGTFSFERKTLGYINPSPSYYDTCTAAHQVPNPNTLDTSVVDTSSAYSGDIIEVKAKGSFTGNGLAPPYRHPSDYQAMFLQIRYEQLGGTLSDFVLDSSQGTITVKEEPNGPTLVLNVNQGDIVYTVDLDSLVRMNFNMSIPLLQSFIIDSSLAYSFDADLFLVFNNKYQNNLPYGVYPISPRAEFMGTITDSTIDHSCDTWGTAFTLLQPLAAFGFSNNSSCCGNYDADFYFRTIGANGLNQDDFPNEFRPYGALDDTIEITVPSGYTFNGADFVMQQRDTGGPNNFNSGFLSPPITISMTPASALPVPGGVKYTFIGIDSLNSCWPLLDVKPYILVSAHPTYHIVVHTKVNCNALQVDTFIVAGGFTEVTNQSNPAYQTHTPISQTYTVTHSIPNLVLVPPMGTYAAYSNSVVFNFTLCNQSLCDANLAWIAFENSPVNSLNFISVIDTLTGIPLPDSAYIDNNGHQALLVNAGTLNTGACLQLQLKAQIDSNGCVPDSIGAVPDSINVFYGNACDGVLPASPPTPQPSCSTNTVQFNFNRHPSDLLILPDQLSPNPYPVFANLCDTLEYNLVLKSSELGAVVNPDFLVALPTGITFQDVTFTYPYGIGTPVILSTFDFQTGWNLNTHFPALSSPGLTGTGTSPNNQVGIIIHLTTDCTYLPNGGSITFSAIDTSSCSTILTDTLTPPPPPLNGFSPPDNLSYSINVSNPVFCNDTGVITITVTNNSTTSTTNHNNILTVIIPSSSNLLVSNINQNGIFISPDTIRWNISPYTIGPSDSMNFSFELSINPPFTTYCPGPSAITASINYSETIFCSTGPACPNSYTYPAIIPDTVNICCNCNIPPFTLTISTTQTDVTCPLANNGSATAIVSGGIPPYTYLWSNGDQSPTTINLSAGTYNVTVTDANGCSATASVTINVLPLIADFIVTGNLCINIPIKFTYSGTGATSWLWDFGDGNTSTLQNPVNIYSTPGTFWVTLTVTDASGLCTATSSQQITIALKCCELFAPVTYDDTLPIFNSPITSSDTLPFQATPYRINKTIIIQAPAVWTIPAGQVIEFGPLGKIIVENGTGNPSDPNGNGAQLVLSPGCKLTSITNSFASWECFVLWQGIEVWGNSHCISSNTAYSSPSVCGGQGKVTMSTGDTIEYAHIGVFLAKSGTCIPDTFVKCAFWDIGHGGGIIDANGAVFKNNASSIQFYPYNKNNSSQIQNCQFTGGFLDLFDPGYVSNNPSYTYPNGNNLYYAAPVNTFGTTPRLAYLWGVRNIIFKDNIFKTADKGIETYDSKSSIIKGTSGNQFLNLNQGISGRYSSSSPFLGDTIRGNTFNNTVLPAAGSSPVAGIYLLASKNEWIQNNTFGDQTLLDSLAQTKNPYGMYLDNSSGFTVLDNDFFKTQVGIFIKNSFTGGGTIRNFLQQGPTFTDGGNFFQQCSTSVQTNLWNSKLKIRCNQTNNDVQSLYGVNWFNSGGQLANQGLTATTQITNPAGNRFHFPSSLPSSNPMALRQIKSTYGLTIIPQSGPPQFIPIPYTYYSHTSPQPYIPLGQNVAVQQQPVPCNNFGCCPFDPCFIPSNPSNCRLAQITNIEQQLSSLQTEFNTVLSDLDKGQTTQLISAINQNNPVPPGQLKNMLLNASPLSDTVLLAFVNRTVAQTPPGIFKDVILPNSPISDSVLPALQIKLTFLPPGIAMQIQDAQANSIVRTLTAISREIDAYKVERQYQINQLLSFYVENDSAQAIQLLEQENTVDSEQQLLGAYLATGNIPAAQAQLSVMSATTPEEQAFLDLQGMLLNLQVQGRSVFEMDSTEEQLVKNIASMPSSLAQANACAILHLAFNENCTEVSPGRTDVNGLTSSPSGRIEEGLLGNNIPNPFNNSTTIPYSLPERTEKAQINIYDITGKLLISYEVGNKNRALTISCEGMENGVYIYKLEAGRIILGSKKMVIIK